MTAKRNALRCALLKTTSHVRERSAPYRGLVVVNIFLSVCVAACGQEGTMLISLASDRTTTHTQAKACLTDIVARLVGPHLETRDSTLLTPPAKLLSM